MASDEHPHYDLGPTVPTSMRLPKSLLDALDDLARKQFRSRTKQVELILVNALQQEGYLLPDTTHTPDGT